MTEDQGISRANKGGCLSRAALFFFLMVVCSGGVTGYDAWRFLTTPAAADSFRDIVIDIKPGATFSQVAGELYRQGAVSDVRRFLLLARFRGKTGSIQAGEFQVNTGWVPGRLLDHLTSGKPLLYRLALREGLPWWEVARLVEAEGFASAAEFKAVIHDQDFLRQYGIPFANAEGFLFPETYLLRKPKTMDGREQAEAVARVLIESFWRHTWSMWLDHAAFRNEKAGNFITVPALRLRNDTLVRAPARDAGARGAAVPSPPPGVPLSAVPGDQSVSGIVAIPTANELPPVVVPITSENLKRLVTLASLVEKETGAPEERARVAGVYDNRLRLGMLLQCDPTVIYGLGENFRGSIRRSQLEDGKNSYNTYQHPGLPPSPIASPGQAALRAALWPEDHNYLYFVAIDDGGKHDFSTNLRDHQRAVDRYRLWQRQHHRR